LDQELFTEMVKKWEYGPMDNLRLGDMSCLVTSVARQLDLPIWRRDTDVVEKLLQKEEYKETVQKCWKSRNFQAIREWCRC
jgi:hypothetical protein